MAKVVFTEFPEKYEEWMEERMEGHETIYYQDVLDADELIEELEGEDVDVLSTFIYTEVSDKVIDSLESLKLVTTRATGFDNIDVKYARENGVEVVNVVGYGAYPVSEFALGLLLTVSRKINEADEFVKREKKIDYRPFRGAEMFGKTLGVIGTGDIGMHLTEIGRGLGMRVIAYDVIERTEKARSIGFEYVDLDELLERSDFISLHVPLLEATYHMIDEESFKKMKDSVYLANAARGGVIDTEALIEALEKGEIAGAGLDAFEDEEDLKDLTELDNIVTTPHIGFHTEEADIRRLETTIENIEATLDKGEPANPVTLEDL